MKYPREMEGGYRKRPCSLYTLSLHLQKLRTQYLPDAKVKYLGRVSYRHIVPWKTIQHIEGLPSDTSSWRRNGEVAFMSPIGKHVLVVSAATVRLC
jgi:hypothetical protein